jgi:alanyl-tRNA synthetase
LAKEHLLVSQISEMLKVKSIDIPDRIDSLLNKLKDAERLLEQQRRNDLLANAEQIIGAANKVGDYDLYAFQADLDMESLRELVARAKGNNPNSIAVALGAGDVPALIVGVGANLIASEVNAKSILQLLISKHGGKGGGKPEMTQGSVPAGADIKAILASLPNLISDLK